MQVLVGSQGLCPMSSPLPPLTMATSARCSLPFRAGSVIVNFVILQSPDCIPQLSPAFRDIPRHSAATRLAFRLHSAAFRVSCARPFATAACAHHTPARIHGSLQRQKTRGIYLILFKVHSRAKQKVIFGKADMAAHGEGLKRRSIFRTKPGNETWVPCRNRDETRRSLVRVRLIRPKPNPFKSHGHRAMFKINRAS